MGVQATRETHPWLFTKANGDRRIHWESHRDEFERMWRDGADVIEMAERFEVSRVTIYNKASRWKLPRRARRGRGQGQALFWTEAKIEALKQLWPKRELTCDDIAVELGAKSRAAVYARAQQLGLPRRRWGHRKTMKERLRAGGGAQRRFVGAAGRKMRFRKLDPKHPAFVEGRTLYPSRVISASKAKHVLVGGENNSKIGRVIMKGRWKGLPVFYVTLQERATCPRTCQQWLNCYGNNLHLALRLRHDEEDFAIHLASELLRLQAKYPNGFVVRLHIVGDFFSLKYVEFWRNALDTLPGLHVFGFTARPTITRIGSALMRLATERWDRFALRWSDRGADFAASEVVKDEADANGIICPAERDENRCCATCGLCWAMKDGRPAVPLITFPVH